MTSSCENAVFLSRNNPQTPCSKLLKTRLRSLWKHKTTTAVNILSLSVGLASCATGVFVLPAYFELATRGFDDSANIYRVVSDLAVAVRQPCLFPTLNF